MTLRALQIDRRTPKFVEWSILSKIFTKYPTSFSENSQANFIVIQSMNDKPTDKAKWTLIAVFIK